MSVILNEPAINALFHSLPVVQRAVQDQAEAAQRALQGRIDQIIENPLVRPQAGIKYTTEGAEVGIINTQGRVDEYLDVKLGVREDWWLDVGEEAARGA